MAYSAEISRANPSCFLFLIDQSGSMQDVIDPTNIQPLQQSIVTDGRTYTHAARGPTKAQGVADAINRLLQNLVLRCTRNEGILNYYYVGVIGYGKSVGPALGGVLTGRELVPISEIGDYPARVEERTRKMPDGAGGLIDVPVKFPIWFDPVANGGTPMCQALQQAHTVLSRWLAEHPNCFPPVVIHITDGESTDGDPTQAMRDLTNLASSDGNVLLFNVHLSANPNANPIAFPDSPTALPDQYARTLFEGSSPLTPAMITIANREHGLQVSDGARGFVLNADMVLVIQALDIGTRSPTER